MFINAIVPFVSMKIKLDSVEYTLKSFRFPYSLVVFHWMLLSMTLYSMFSGKYWWYIFGRPSIFETPLISVAFYCIQLDVSKSFSLCWFFVSCPLHSIEYELETYLFPSSKLISLWLPTIIVAFLINCPSILLHLINMNWMNDY